MSENSKKCFMDSCPNEPIYFCDCQDNHIFACVDHAYVHGHSEDQHNFENLYSEIHEETRKTAFEHFFRLKSELESYKSRIKIQANTPLPDIPNLTQSILQNLEDQNQKFDEYISQINNIKVIDNSKASSFIESLLKLSPEHSSKIKNIKLHELL